MSGPLAAAPHVAPELVALVAPYRVFAELAAEPEQAPGGRWLLLVRRPLLLLLVIGAFVSFTTAQRLVVGHVAWAMIGWGFLPLLQVGALAATAVLVAGRPVRDLPRLVDLSYLSRAPWLVFFAGFVVVHLTSGDVNGSFFSVFLRSPMIAGLIACVVWSRVIEHAFWRSALGLSRWRALLAVLVSDVLVLGPGVVWYLANEQLQPLLGGSP